VDFASSDVKMNEFIEQNELICRDLIMSLDRQFNKGGMKMKNPGDGV
jgi:hypothetical protein